MKQVSPTSGRPNRSARSISPFLLGLAAALALLWPANMAVSEEAWRGDWRVFRIGLVSGRPQAAFDRWIEPFRNAMQAAIGIPVEVVASPTFAALIEAHAGLHIHYAVYSASAYATAHLECACVTPLAVPRAGDGGRGFHAILVVPKASPLHQIADLKGRRLALGRPGSLAGDLVPRAALDAAGLRIGKDLLAVGHGGPLKAVSALRRGFADAATGWSSLTGRQQEGYSRGTLRHLGEMGGSPDEFRVLWSSKVIPHGPHAVNVAVPEPLRVVLIGFLESLNARDPLAYAAVERYYGGGFAAISHTDFVPLIEALTRQPE